MSDSSNTNFRFEGHGKNRLFFGLVLIVLGILFLLQQLGLLDFTNWWAIFILIPAFGSFSTAWYAYRRWGYNEAVRSSVGGGFLVLTVAVIFLFNLNWALWWPLIIIVVGLNIFSNGFVIPGSIESQRPFSHHFYRAWLGWVGIGVIALGTGFLANSLEIFNPAAVLVKWWALPILIPAVGGVFIALRLLISGKGFGWASISNIVATVVFAAVGLVALLGINWNLLTPIILIAIGILLLTGVFRRE